MTSSTDVRFLRSGNLFNFLQLLQNGRETMKHFFSFRRKIWSNKQKQKFFFGKKTKIKQIWDFVGLAAAAVSGDFSQSFVQMSTFASNDYPHHLLLRLSLTHTHTLSPSFSLTLSLTNCWSTNKISCLPPNPIKSYWNKGLSYPSGGSTDEVCCVFRFRPKRVLTVKLVILSLTRIGPSSGRQKQHRFRLLKMFFQCH